MTSPPEGVLDALLGELPESDRGDARRLVTYLRLLRDDARGLRAEGVGLDLAGTRSELERRDRSRLLELYGDLMRFHLEASLPRDAFRGFGAPRRRLGATWSAIEAYRTAGRAAVEVPEPGEPPLAVAERVLAAARPLDPGQGWCAVWGARLASVRDGIDAAEPAWRELQAQARVQERLPLEAAATLALAQAELERFRVRHVRDLLDQRPVLIAAVEELAWLRAWVHLLLGEEDAARELLRGRRARRGRLPAALDERRRRRPGWGDVLSGEVPLLGGDPVSQAVAARAAFGATVLGVFVLGPDRNARPAVLDAAPGARARVLEAWRRREGAWTQVGAPEHRVLVGGREVVEHRVDDVGPRAALAGSDALAVALVPVLDTGGEPRGWIHLECEHHLLPSLARARAWAAAWWRELRAARVASEIAEARPAFEPGERIPARPIGSEEAALQPREGDPLPQDTLTGEEGRQLLGRLPLKLSRRRALLFDWGEAARERGAPLFVAAAGAGFPGATPHASCGSGRCIRAAAPLLHAGEPELTQLPGARSGLLVPIVLGGVVHGLLVVESARARDLGQAELALAAAFAAREAMGWRLVQFRRWHRASFALDVRIDPGAQAWRGALHEWLALARSREPLLLQGPPGSGKRTMARWIHFEGAGPRAPLAQGPGGPPVESDSVPGSWILDPCNLTPRSGARLVEGSAVRPLALCTTTLEEERRAGRIDPALAALFEGFELTVPPLAERRDEIPSLARFLAADEARRSRAEPLGFSRAALELLWRQRWEGNVGQLAAWIRRLSRTHAGRELAREELLAFARRGGKRLRTRLPSRRPRREDVLSALVTTRHAAGGWNKTAAACLLGWDPGTLLARMRDLGLESEV